MLRSEENSRSGGHQGTTREKERAGLTGLFGGVFGRGDVAAEVGDAAWLAALLDAEAALARAHARAGRIPPTQAEAIASACVPSNFDVDALATASTGAGNPVVPLVHELTRAVGGEAARHVHEGATSQDIMDTAAMLVCHRAGAVLRAETEAACAQLAALAHEHRSTVMAGRTLLQQALPTTFGAVTAGWLEGLGTAARALDTFLETGTFAQLGGAAGTLASLGDDGPVVLTAYAAELGLIEPVVPWHTARGPIAELAGSLARVCGAAGKAAGDIVLLAQTETGEVTEAGGAGVGGSSTLPHKRNPIAAVSAVACAEQAPGLVSTLLTCQAQQHQRAAGRWHAEWLPLADLLRTTGSAVAWLGTSLERLRVDPQRMRANLDLTGGFPLAERVTTDIASELGRLEAHELVQDACQHAASSGRGLAEVLAERLRGRRTEAQVASLLDPTGYVGSTGAFVARALAAHAARTSGPHEPTTDPNE